MERSRPKPSKPECTRPRPSTSEIRNPRDVDMISAYTSAPIPDYTHDPRLYWFINGRDKF